MLLRARYAVTARPRKVPLSSSRIGTIRPNSGTFRIVTIQASKHSRTPGASRMCAPPQEGADGDVDRLGMERHYRRRHLLDRHYLSHWKRAYLTLLGPVSRQQIVTIRVPCRFRLSAVDPALSGTARTVPIEASPVLPGVSRPTTRGSCVRRESLRTVTSPAGRIGTIRYGCHLLQEYGHPCSSRSG